ncbi:hypothetical protein C8R44DRAFT_417154 [Mycena epipterygia]|nr:hypothetical protein C8R44DRAFT_417154 [Mycena epipterygia]
MDPAIPTLLEDIGPDLLGKKLRVAGQALAYDAHTGLALLRSRNVAVMLDATQCVSAWAGRDWVGEHLCTVTAVGYLERAPTGLRVPALPLHFPATRIEEGLVLRALLVVARPELDMGLWRAGVEAIHDGGETAAASQ